MVVSSQAARGVCLSESPEESGPAPGAKRGTAAPRFSARAWIWFLVFEAVVALIYFPFGIPSGHPRILGAVPWMEWTGQVPAWAVLGLSAVAAIAFGAYQYRPRARLAWWFMGGGVLLFIAGDTIYKSWHQIIGQQNIPFPSFVDAIYITMYPVLATGLLLLARSRRRGGDEASLLDALIVTLGVGLLSWIFLIGPNVRAPGGLLVRLTAAAYPLGDVLILAMLAHLWSSGGLRTTAGRLLAIGTVGTLVADSIYGLAGLHSGWNWNDGNPFDIGWIVFYGCWGAAALHPSMRQLSERQPTAPARTSRSRLMLLGAVSLIAPAVLLFETVSGKPIDAAAVAGVAGVMFLLVVLRMSGVVRAHQEAVTREQVLRQEAGELVGAPDRPGIHEATIKAVAELIGGQAGVLSISLVIADELGALGVAAQSGAAGEAPCADLTTLPPAVKESLAAGRAVRYVHPPDPAANEQVSHIFVCPVVTAEHQMGLIEVQTAGELPLDLTNPLETLAAQVGLALDRESLTEVFHARRSEARFQTLVQNASDVILIARPDTTITYQTPSAQRILGVRPGRPGGTPADFHAPPERRREGGRGLRRGGVPSGNVDHGRVADTSR